MSLSIGILAGSLRAGSFNRQLAALAAAHLRTAGHEVTEIDLAEYPLPIFDQAIEDAGFPEDARALKARLAAQDALVIASPEYNGSLPALLKNAIDWSSRSSDGEAPMVLTAWRDKPVAIMGASPGAAGAMRSLMHLRQILTLLQCLVIAPQFTLPEAHKSLVDGAFADARTHKQFTAMLDALVRTATAMKAAHD